MEAVFLHFLSVQKAIGADRTDLSKCKKFGKTYSRFIVARLAFSLALTAPYTAGTWIMVRSAFDLGFQERVAITSLMSLNMFLGLMSPPAAATVFLCLSIISAQLEMMNAAVDKIKFATAKKLENADDAMKELLSNAESFCSAAAAANDLLSPFLVLHFFTLVLFGITVLYGSFACVFGAPSLHLFLLSSSYVGVAAVCFFQVHRFCLVGQLLVGGRRRWRTALDDLAIRTFDSLSPPTKQWVSAAGDRLESGVLSPFGLFEISNSSSLTICSFLVGYLIVMLQFRVS